jgi:hypothetical protein
MSWYIIAMYLVAGQSSIAFGKTRLLESESEAESEFGGAGFKGYKKRSLKCLQEYNMSNRREYNMGHKASSKTTFITHE